MKVSRTLKSLLVFLATVFWVGPACAAPPVGGQPKIETGCQSSGLSRRQRKALRIVNESTDKLIHELREEDRPEFAKSWYFSGAVGFNQMVDPILRDKKFGLYSSLKTLGCKDEREMEWFMARMVHLRLAKKAETRNEMLSLIREQIKNIDDAWEKAGKQKLPNG